MGRRFLTAWVALALVLAACSDTDSSFMDLNVDSSSIALEAAVGETVDASFTVGNSDARGRPERYEVLENAAWLSVLSGGSGSLKGGNEATVTLRATCASSGERQTALTVTSNRAPNETLTVSLSCTGDDPPPPPPSGEFEITLIFSSSITEAQKDVFRQAAAKWATMIVGDVADATFNKPAGECGAGEPAFNGTVDDVVIYASVEPIDGRGNILGSAGPCYVRGGNALPLYGTMRFDSADVDSLGSSFEDVILHEMGHVLGVGTLWNYKGLLDFNGSSCSNSTSIGFTGSEAKTQYALLGGSGNVPVENGGGSGTKCGHWDEETFDNELMTGYLSSQNPCCPLSAITVGSLEDTGYSVNLEAADAYAIPSCSPACLRTGAADDRIHIAAREVLLAPVASVSPTGEVKTFER